MTRTGPLAIRACTALEIQRRAKGDDPRVRSELAIGVKDAATRLDDVLEFGLQRPPLSQLRLIHHLDHRFVAAHRKKEVTEKSGIGVQSARVVADARVGEGNADLVVGAARQAFVEQAAIGIEADEIAVVRDAARANKSRKALIIGAGTR